MQNSRSTKTLNTNQSHKGANMNMTKTQLRQVVKTINAQLSNAQLTDLIARQRLIATRETAYTAIKQMQDGMSYTQLKPMLDAAGLFSERKSFKRKEAWNDARFVSIGETHGKISVMHNLVESDAGSRGKKVRTRKGSYKIVPKGVTITGRYRDTYRMRDVRNADHTLRGTVRERLETNVPMFQVGTQSTHAPSAIASAETLLENAMLANDGSKAGKARVTRAAKRVLNAREVAKNRPATIEQVKPMAYASEVKRGKAYEKVSQ
jgi:hypothetical protein